MKKVICLAFILGLLVAESQAQPSNCAIGALLVDIKQNQNGGVQLTVFGVMTNSPAARAGLAQGQVVRAINGIPTRTLKPSQCVRLIQGAAGTKVVLLVEDRKHGWTNSLTATREVVPDDPLMADPDGFDIPQSDEQVALAVTTNQVIRVLNNKGSVTLIQFTTIGATNANYRWRARAAAGGITSGTGTVRENYEKKASPLGGYQLVNLGSDDDLFVKAGDVRLEWSANNLTSCWLYYYPSQERLKILKSADFNSELK